VIKNHENICFAVILTKETAVKSKQYKYMKKKKKLFFYLFHMVLNIYNGVITSMMLTLSI